MKTIKGVGVTKKDRCLLSERISDIIPLTQDYFRSWHSHDRVSYPGEPEILPNAIYVFPNGRVHINKVGCIDLEFRQSDGSVLDICEFPNCFFEENHEYRSVSNPEKSAILITLNGRRLGYYLTAINTLVLSDVTHDRSCVRIFTVIFPDMIRELGLMPIVSNEKLTINEVTVGCDPEFELIADGDVLEASQVISEGTRAKIGCDGAGDQVEIRPDANSQPIQVTQNIRKLIKTFSEKYPDLDLTDAGDTYPLGGHIHIGIGISYMPDKKLIELLDDFIGKPTINLSGDARSDYKQLGQVRSQPHGFEYRSTPASVFQEPAISCIVMKLAKNLTTKFLREQTLKYNSKPTIEDYVKVGGLSNQQAKYFMEFIRNKKPKQSIIAAWKVKKPEMTLYEPNLVFKDVWSQSLKNAIVEMFRCCEIKFKDRITIEYYGLKAARGNRLCTIRVPGLQRTSSVKTLYSGSTVKIGISHDIRTISSPESTFVTELVSSTKNFINNQING